MNKEKIRIPKSMKRNLTRRFTALKGKYCGPAIACPLCKKHILPAGNGLSVCRECPTQKGRGNHGCIEFMRLILCEYPVFVYSAGVELSWSKEKNKYARRQLATLRREASKRIIWTRV